MYNFTIQNTKIKVPKKMAFDITNKPTKYTNSNSARPITTHYN